MIEVYAILRYLDEDVKILDDKIYKDKEMADYICSELNSLKSKYSTIVYEVVRLELT